MIPIPDSKQTKYNKFLVIKIVVSQTQRCMVNTGKERDTKTTRILTFLAVMNDSVPAMLDTFHLHKLPSHGRCSGICLNPAKGFCLDSTKMVLNTTVMFYHFQIKYKNILKIPPQFKKKCNLTETISCIPELQ